MDAHTQSIQEFLSQTKTQFVIPVYQRNYDWTIVQCRQLLDDILRTGEEGAGVHFVGSIVYIHDNVYTSASIKELVIIDGQQRLTTLMLIYIVLYRLAKTLNNENLFAEINETYLINKFVANSEKLKLRPTENNDKAFRFLLSNAPLSEYTEYSNIIENFSFLNGHITAENYTTVLQGLKKLIFVEISLERGKDDPQKIFESLNSTGLDLSQADLIRNYILMGLKAEEQNRLYSQYWSFIEQNARDVSANESKVSDFIRDCLTLENKKIPNKNKVYFEFKAKYPFETVPEIESVLANIKRLAKHYNKLINPSAESDKDICREITFINRLESAVAYPFLLQVYDDYANQIINKDVFLEVLNLVQSFIWRRFIVGLPTNALNKIFMNLYDKVDKDNYLESLQISLLQRTGTQRFPKNDEVIEALKWKDLYNINLRNTHYFLEKLENYNNKERVVIQGNPDITVEHIFPQNPDPDWKKTLEKEYDIIKEKYLHTISNLTLSGNNGKLGNKSFTSKKELPEFGYRASRLWLNKFLVSIDTWNIDALEKRFTRIKKRFLEIWQYPDIPLDMFQSEGEVSIFEADDPTGKSFNYMIFRDEKKPVKSGTELYVEVVKQLFFLYPEKFFSADIKDVIQLTHIEDKDNLRQSAEINDSWVINTHSSNQDKFRKIKSILSFFGCEDDLVIKYA